MQQTSNYALKKIELADSPPDITVINTNWDTIDTELKKLSNATADGATAEQLKALESKIGSLTNLTTTEKTNLVAAINEIRLTIANHSVNESNPHKVTKSQVGLGNVGNFAIATQVEAETGTSDIRYMTPLKVKQAVETLAPVGLKKLGELDFTTSPTGLSSISVPSMNRYLIIIRGLKSNASSYVRSLHVKANNDSIYRGNYLSGSTVGHLTSNGNRLNSPSADIMKSTDVSVKNSSFVMELIKVGGNNFFTYKIINYDTSGFGTVDVFAEDITSFTFTSNGNQYGELIVAGSLEIWGGETR